MNLGTSYGLLQMQYTVFEVSAGGLVVVVV
jgi:hypothetical protein